MNSGKGTIPLLRIIVPPAVGSYSYAEMSDANPDAVTQIANGVATTTYGYDNNGNLTSAGTSTFSWDYNNRMTQAVTQSSTSTYAYDFAGNRVSQTCGSTTTIYPNKYYSITSTTNGATTYATTTVYVWNGDAMVATIDQVLINGTATGTAATRYIHPDHLGSTNIVSDESGNIVADTEYYPYGETRLNQTTYPTKEQRQFIGQFKDGNSLSYLNARYLDNNRGQFLSEDPSFLSVDTGVLQDPQQLNAYAYGRANPIILFDKNGKKVELVGRYAGGSLIGGHDFILITNSAADASKLSGVGIPYNIPDGTRFTLGGYPDSYSVLGNIYKGVNHAGDYDLGESQYISRYEIKAPAGYKTETDFENAIIGSYNALPDDLGPYSIFGNPTTKHQTISNNVASSILMGAGVNANLIRGYQNPGHVTPGLGYPVSSSPGTREPVPFV